MNAKTTDMNARSVALEDEMLTAVTGGRMENDVYLKLMSDILDKCNVFSGVGKMVYLNKLKFMDGKNYTYEEAKRELGL